MEKDGTLNLILAHDTVDEANRLVSLLRNASYKVEPHYVGSTAELGKKIQERNWDLALVQFEGETVPAKSFFHQTRKLNKDIPIFLVVSEYDPSLVLEGLRMGAACVVPMDEDQHILQMVSRSLYALDQRRRLRYWKRRYAESEQRYEELLLSSSHGIAIIQEGTYIYVNDAFAQCFGYIDREGMTLLPVLDSLHPSHHKAFKKFLKPLSDEDAWEEETVEFDGISPDGSPFPVKGTIAQVEFHGEPALQLLIRKEFLAQTETGGAAETEETSHTTVRLHPMLEHISHAIRRAVRTAEDTMLFYIHVDRYSALQQEFGISATEAAIVKLANFIADGPGQGHTFGRIREDAFILLMDDTDPDQALAQGEDMAQAVAGEFFEVNDATLNFTLSIGISAISEATTSAEGCIDRSRKAVDNLRKGSERKDVGNGASFFEAVFETSAPEISTSDVIRIGKQMLEKHRLDIAFQPIVSLHGKYSEQYEVLMRVRPDAFPEDLPEDFVDKVFKTEAGREIDRWVILEAIKALGRKKKTHPNTRLFLNLSAATLEDEHFMPWLKLALKAAGVVPQDLVFQLREIDVSRHTGKAAALVENIRKVGAGTALSHYGLAINPLDIFRKFQVDLVKLDKLLVEKAQSNEDGMEAMLELINGLKGDEQQLVVPFVETASIIPALWQAHVDYVQGHYIQAPSPTMNYEFSEES